MNTQTKIIEAETEDMDARQPNTLPAIATPMQMIDRALVAGAAPETLEKLLALQERWEANQGRKAFDAAIAVAKAEIPVIRKNRHVGFRHRDGDGQTDYWHEDLAEIARTVDPILSSYGLSYRYRSKQEDGRVFVTCVLTHRDGYSEETTLSASPDASGKKNGIQQVGSAITYLQRYTLKMALGLAAGRDDDAKSAEQSDDDIAAVSEEQLQTLRLLIEETETDIAKFCELGKIESLPDMLAKDFPDAVRLLEQKKARMQKEQAA